MLDKEETNMPDYNALVVLDSAAQRDRYAKMLPPEWRYVTVGSSLRGVRADAVFIGPRVDPRSDWFREIVHLRLEREDSPVMFLSDLFMSRKDGSS